MFLKDSYYFRLLNFYSLFTVNKNQYSVFLKIMNFRKFWSNYKNMFWSLKETGCYNFKHIHTVFPKNYRESLQDLWPGKSGDLRSSCN